MEVLRTPLHEPQQQLSVDRKRVSEIWQLVEERACRAPDAPVCIQTLCQCLLRSGRLFLRTGQLFLRSPLPFCGGFELTSQRRLEAINFGQHARP